MWAGVNGSMEEMHNIGRFILGYVTFLAVGRVVDAVRCVPRRLLQRSSAALPPLAFARTAHTLLRFAAAARATGLTSSAVQGWHNMYEMLWACNVAMVLAGYGILTDRPSETRATSPPAVVWLRPPY